jgi:hypothetical protein
MKRLLPILVGVLCLSVVAVDAQDKPKRKNGGGRPALTEDQKSLMKEIRTKYDTNKDGKLDADERKKISAEDKEKLEKAGLGPRKNRGKDKSK